MIIHSTLSSRSVIRIVLSLGVASDMTKFLSYSLDFVNKSDYHDSGIYYNSRME